MTHLHLARSPSFLVVIAGACCGFLALAGGSNQARAQDAPPRASFACARAATLDETLICSDVLLSQRDAELARQYRALLRSTNDAARAEELRNDQHAWILRRNAECGVFKGTLITDANRAGYIDCFLDAYAERAADLRRMGSMTTLAPRAISMPIRKSLPSAAPHEFVGARRFISDTGITVAPGPIDPQVRWLDADRLAVIDASHALITWSVRGRKSQRTDVTLPVGGQDALCAADGALYLSDHPGSASAALRKLAIDGVGHGTTAPDAEARRGGCPIEIAALGAGRVALADPGGAWVLSLGSISRGRAPTAPRFVTEQQGGRPPMPVAPPIRLDSRFSLGGAYLEFEQRFVVWYRPARLPRAEAQAELRRWAKSDCLPFWVIDPATGSAQTRCIPFGGYNQVRPIPVLAKTKWFLIATTAPKLTPDETWLGFYAIGPGNEAQRIYPGALQYASTSPDGCKIALVDAKFRLTIFDACAAFPG